MVIGSKMDPTDLREFYKRSNPVLDPYDEKALQINPMDWSYPFENMIMEGGGNKGIAYCGAIKCFEDLGLMKQIKRIGGASAGALASAMVALGYTSDEMFELLSGDLESVFMDHSCSYFSLIPNLLERYGWNPGNKALKWFGDAIEKKTGNPETTFRELYQSTGIELCVIVTNVNRMRAEHCHPKTTPDMPIRDALRMTMSIPGVFAAVRYDNHGETDVYVDGGVLCNYPINCFDGWFLSMDQKDSFMQRIVPLEDLPNLMDPENSFKATGPNKSVGFLLFAEPEREIMRFRLEKRIGSLYPSKPREETKVYLEKQELLKKKGDAEKEHARVVLAVKSFLQVLKKHNMTEQQYLSRQELKKAFDDKSFSDADRQVLFGKDYTLDKAFAILDQDENNKISVFELLQFIEERGIRLQTRSQGYTRRKIDSFESYITALQSTLLTNLLRINAKETDVARTVGINTGHVGTMDYTLEDADKEFAFQRGYNSTLSFLRYYVVDNENTIKRRSPDVTSKQPKPSRNV